MSHACSKSSDPLAPPTAASSRKIVRGRGGLNITPRGVTIAIASAVVSLSLFLSHTMIASIIIFKILTVGLLFTAKSSATGTVLLT